MMVDLQAGDLDVAARTRVRRRCRCASTGASTPGMGLGGAAVHWSAQLWRYLETDFRYRSHVVERYGAQKIPPGCTVQDWGVTYDELEPYYDAFEWDIGASGQAGNIRGKKIPGGNPFESPRSRDYPNPPLQVTPHGANFAAASESLGLHPFTQPSGIVSRAWTDPYGNHRGGCLYCGFCTRFGCEVDAKASPLNTHLPVALNTGNYEVRTHAKVLRIETGQDGLATGVTYVDAHGERALPARRRRRRLGVHAREQPAAAALTQHSPPGRDRQRPRPGRARTTRTRSTRRRSPGSGRARS